MVWCAEKLMSTARIDGKTVIVTGASSGIGITTTMELYRRGGRVIMACRNVQKAEEVKKDIIDRVKGENNLGELVIRCLDVSSMKSVRQCAKEILDEEPQINILINNAGIMMSPPSYTEDDFEIQLATNHLGHFLFTLLLLPRILKSTPARIINVSSTMYDMGEMNFDDLNWKKTKYSPAGAYARSKLANILFSMELVKRLEGKGIVSYALHPGIVKTNVTQHLGESVSWGTRMLFGFVTKFFSINPEEGAQTTLHCTLDEKLATQTGLYYSDCKEAKTKKNVNPTDAEKLWEASVALLNLGDYDPLTAVDEGPKKQ